MMSLSHLEWSFLEKRSKLIRNWPWVGGGLLILLIALTIWLCVSVPYLVRPWMVAAGLKSGTLPHSTQLVMAELLPIVVLMFVTSAAIMVVYCFVAFSNERKLIQIIRWQVASQEVNGVAMNRLADQKVALPVSDILTSLKPYLYYAWGRV